MVIFRNKEQRTYNCNIEQLCTLHFIFSISLQKSTCFISEFQTESIKEVIIFLSVEITTTHFMLLENDVLLREVQRLLSRRGVVT